MPFVLWLSISPRCMSATAGSVCTFSPVALCSQLQALLTRSPWERLHGSFSVAGNDTRLKQAVKLQQQFETLKWQRKLRVCKGCVLHSPIPKREEKLCKLFDEFKTNLM